MSHFNSRAHVRGDDLAVEVVAHFAALVHALLEGNSAAVAAARTALKERGVCLDADGLARKWEGSRE